MKNIKHRENIIYSIYKGEEHFFTGNMREIIEKTGLSRQTVQFYASPAHLKRFQKRKNGFVATRWVED